MSSFEIFVSKIRHALTKLLYNTLTECFYIFGIFLDVICMLFLSLTDFSNNQYCGSLELK